MGSTTCNQELGKFASMLANKIRNPLNAIMLHSSLLKRSTGLSANDRKHLKVIDDETLKVDLLVTEIIDDILKTCS